MTPDYEINSDRESGFGRYDISVIPKNTDKQAIIIELKTINKKQTAKQALEDALLQIEKNNMQKK
ncbi:MAG: PD-(D/E)XK nuclease domain-containing protein [Deltaproteobacteria bacterium]|nr:PD-(D/E)XK nuclease domain-containing protein [Deltaproteobacteria bacterium]